MKIATYNVNGVNGRLPVLLRWLTEAQPDVVCLQELKAPQEKFPLTDVRKAGYGAVWHGQKAWNGVAILARGIDPVETRRGLPGDPDDLSIAAISRPPSPASPWDVFICRTAIPRPDRNSITSSRGSSDFTNTVSAS
jgi:exonuclease III